MRHYLLVLPLLLGAARVHAGVHGIVPVSEPGTVSLMLLSGAGLALWIRSRKRK
jgi:PEP-CTERM motif-containing protein